VSFGRTSQPDGETIDDSTVLSVHTRMVAETFREHLDVTALSLVDDARHEPDLLAIAGLSHCCMLLEEIDQARLRGNSLVVGLLCRAHFEAMITAGWLFLGREAAVDKLLGDLKRAVRLQHEALARSDADGLSLLRSIRKHNRKLEKQNAHRRRARERGIEIDLLTPVREPVIRLVATDLSDAWRAWGYRDVNESDVGFEEIAAALRPLAAKAGLPHGNWDAAYNVVYRSLSSFAAHPSYWLLDTYVSRGKLFASVMSSHPEEQHRMTMAAEGAVGLTAQFSAAILEPRGVDVAIFRVVSQWYEGRFEARGRRIRENLE
jgi:hypothetical protein